MDSIELSEVEGWLRGAWAEVGLLPGRNMILVGVVLDNTRKRYGHSCLDCFGEGSGIGY